MTDADVVAGRIPPSAILPDLGALDLAAATAALADEGLEAEGVLAVVDEAMVQAVRAVTVARGVDPRDLALVAFGGAGPLHACAIAEALAMPAVVVPPRAGVLSAVGILGASRQVDLVRSWPADADPAGLDDALVDLASVARGALGNGATVEVAVDCRYGGQSHEITVPDIDDFEAEHERRNGYARPGAPIEVVAIRATARAAAEVDLSSIPRPAGKREPATGPCVLAEGDCTVWVAPGWRADVHASGSWILTRSAP